MRSTRCRRNWLAFLLVVLAQRGSLAADVCLLVDGAPASGLVVAHVDLTAAVRWSGTPAVVPQAVRGENFQDGSTVPLQFVPDADFDAVDRIAGTVLLGLGSESDGRVRLRFGPDDRQSTGPFDGTVSTPSFTVTHDPKEQAGLPSRIEFSSTGKVFDAFRWYDRTYHRELGGFRLIDDAEAKVSRISNGPLATVIRVEARYVRPDGSQPESKPHVTYQWFYFRDRPLVLVTADQRQREPFTWPEWHFLELNFPGDDFPGFVGGEPSGVGQFTGSEESSPFQQWAALVDKTDSIAMLHAGQMSIYDGRTGYGNYLHAHVDTAWSPFSRTSRRMAAWLRIATDDDPASAIRAAAAQLPSRAHVAVTVDTVRSQIEEVRRKVDGSDSPARRETWWHAAGAEQLEAAGRFSEAIAAAAGKTPPGWTVTAAGSLGMILEQTDAGIRLIQLTDVQTGRQWSAPKALPLFTLVLRHTGSKEEVRLDADAAWNEVDVEPVAEDSSAYRLRWAKPHDPRLGNLSVVARLACDRAAGAFRWTLRVDGQSDPWSVWRVVFPQLAVAEPGPEATLFFPRAAGEEKRGAWRQAFSFQGTYPSGWTSMPFMAAYDGGAEGGIYVAVHDPFGGTKDILLKSRPEDRVVQMSIDHPAADMGTAGNSFELSGEAVWRIFRGDWFDAALIYRDWVRNEAAWFPPLTSEGRADTPEWMRNLSVWLVGGGAPADCVEDVKKFQKYMDVPVGFHWYNWHQIPFDNDYPHYFPTKQGFAEAVRELREADIYVMPYINGRLWDTHDRGAEDFQFTQIARAAATKDEQGEPYVEVYGSKETDGSSVELAAMCPTTDLWQGKVRQIVTRLFDECGTAGVYIDQIAAAKPRLCFDSSHGHPLGGGHWWTEHGYWPLMEQLHAAMPQDRMLTTECNAEPYVRWFDGYLTWHWQYDGQVPAFPAVYGGAIQMFGRAYRGGPTKDLALRMKAGQQLVFGEQIGWIHPGVVREEENAAFLRQVVRLRGRLIRYFAAGQMARPPKLLGQIPTVTADWRWSGQWPVTTDAVMTGAWALPDEQRLALLFVNVSDQAVSAQIDFDAARYGLSVDRVHVAKLTAEGAEKSTVMPSAFNKQLSFPPRTGWAWEVRSE